MLISIKSDSQHLKSTSCTFKAYSNVQAVIYQIQSFYFFHKFYFILQPVAFKGAVSKNAVQCRTASKQDRLQYKTTAPFATVQQFHVKLHLARYIPEKK